MAPSAAQILPPEVRGEESAELRLMKSVVSVAPRRRFALRGRAAPVTTGLSVTAGAESACDAQRAASSGDGRILRTSYAPAQASSYTKAHESAGSKAVKAAATTRRAWADGGMVAGGQACLARRFCEPYRRVGTVPLAFREPGVDLSIAASVAALQREYQMRCRTMSWRSRPDHATRRVNRRYTVELCAQNLKYCIYFEAEKRARELRPA